MPEISVNKKWVEYQLQKDNQKIITFFLGFRTAFGVNSWNDIVLDSFYSALHTSGIEDDNILALDENTIEIIVIDKDLTFRKLDKWGFKLIEKREKVEIKKNLLPKQLSVKQINLILEQATLFKDSDCLIDSNGNTSISFILQRISKKLGTPTKLFCIPFYSFISLIEWENKILAKLSGLYNFEQKLSYYKTFRLYELLDIYEDFIKNAVLTQREFKGWKIIDLNRLYNMLYKFGGKYQPKYFEDTYNSVFKPYRSDFVYIINKKWLHNQKPTRILDKEIIIPNITLVSK